MKPLTLADCGDVLTTDQLCRVLQISQSQYYALRSHRAFPLKPVPGLGGAVRYAKVAVERYLASGSVNNVLMRKAV